MGKRTWGVVAVAAVCLLGWSGTAGAGISPSRYLYQSLRKGGRGLANALTAPLELIREPYLVSEEDGGLAGVTVGIARGLGSALIREGAGLIELGTFCLPFPNKEFQPLVKPEFVYAHGDWSARQ